MRKFIATILAVLYLAVSSGVVLHAYYCLDKLVEVGLITSHAEKCSNCGMEETVNKKNSCCKDEFKLVKLDINQKASDASFQFLKLFSQFIPVSFFKAPAIYFASVTESNPTSNAPPRTNGLAIYKRNCVFLI